MPPFILRTALSSDQCCAGACAGLRGLAGLAWQACTAACGAHDGRAMGGSEWLSAAGAQLEALCTDVPPYPLLCLRPQALYASSSSSFAARSFVIPPSFVTHIHHIWAQAALKGNPLLQQDRENRARLAAVKKEALQRQAQNKTGLKRRASTSKREAQFQAMRTQNASASQSQLHASQAPVDRIINDPRQRVGSQTMWDRK